MQVNRKNFIVCCLLALSFVISGCQTGTKLASDSNMYEEAPLVINSPEYDEVNAVYEHGNIDASSEEIKLALSQKTFHFAFNSSDIAEEDHKNLNFQAAYYTSSVGKDEKIVIEGHTDQVGTRTYNLALGERRANSIKDYLENKGVSANRIEVRSYGFEKPVIPGFSKEACSANRRAVISSEK